MVNKKSKKKKQKNMLMYILAIVAIILILLLLLYTQTDVFSGSVLDYKNRPFSSDPDTNSDSDSGGSSDFDDTGPSDENNEDEEQIQKSWTGGGYITEGAPCIIYKVDETFDTPRLWFSYTADWDDLDECCTDCTVRWTIYEGTKFLKTITQTSPGSGQTYITNYKGGNIKLCVEQTCDHCCQIVVSYTLQILD
jgi:hypothetical protein